MKLSLNSRYNLLFAVLIATVVGFAAPAHAVSFSELYKSGFEALNGRIYRAVGSLRICAANEVKPWLVNDVAPKFRES
jgi:hypothetical protein